MSDHDSQESYEKSLDKVSGLKELVDEHGDDSLSDDPYVLMDFVLEALHQHSMIGKEDLDDRRSYSDMLGSMLGSMGDMDDFEDFDT